MPAADFAPLAHALATDHTVVTYDPRGLAHSTIDDPDQDATPELRADDVAALIDALGAEPADVFGSSGGAVTGLALVARHPDKVAHPGRPRAAADGTAARRRGATRRHRGHHRDVPPRRARGRVDEVHGQRRLRHVDRISGAPVGPEPTPDEQAKQLADMTRFFDHEMRYTIAYRPDIDALKPRRHASSSGSVPIRPIC